jgi:D-alanyl-D-alanine carboxypeptidase/D-alanyl-D-alanine-endopeptidase (penicillin-binding protein 4)
MGPSRSATRDRQLVPAPIAVRPSAVQLVLVGVAIVCALLTLVTVLAGPACAATNTLAGTSPPSDVAPAPASSSMALSQLQRKLGADINGHGGNNSALVVDETTGRTLWALNDNVERLPASVQKLWTTSAALLEMGPGDRLRTKVLGQGRITANGTFIGTLYLRGGGDPTFGSGTFDHKAYRTGATVQALAARIGALGIRRIEGTIVGDATYFDALHGGPDTHYRANLETEGSLSGLSFDAGFTDLYENELDADQPRVAAQSFALALRAQGIVIPAATSIAVGPTPAAASVLTSVGSPPLSKLVELTNSPSDDFFAETLLKDLGAQYGTHGSTAAGAAVVSRVIEQQFGLKPRLDDGSGLSRYDRTSPRQIVLLLKEMRSDAPFYNSLAIAGVRGTMKDEMRRTRGADNCRGKTGTLHDVANLVGYCTAANGDKLVFAFMMNGLTDALGGHQLEDLAGEALASYRG